MKREYKRALSVLLAVFLLLGSMPMTGIADFLSVQTVALNEVLFEENETCITSYQVGDHVEFGWYPQSEVKDPDVVAALNVVPGEWISYEYYNGTGAVADGNMTSSDYMLYKDVQLGDNKYRGVQFSEYRPIRTGAISSIENTHQDENGYYTGTIYWFQYEPLNWYVLNPTTGMVLCEMIVDSQAYNNFILASGKDEYNHKAYWGDVNKNYYANNYAESSLRKWLNDEFYNTAFSPAQQSIINYTLLDNTASYSAFDSEATEDKVFLLSLNDVKDTAYYFSPSLGSNNTQQAYVCGTDYAKCQGLYEKTYNEHTCSDWRLRTPGIFSSYTLDIDYHDYVNAGLSDLICYYVSCSDIGIRPALCFETDSGIFQSNVKEIGIKPHVCGENLKWTLEDGKLTISGSGAMFDYLWPEEIEESTPDALKSPFRDLVFSTLSVEEGVTRIGDCAFEEWGTDSHFLQSVSLPSTLHEIGNDVFCECIGLEYIHIPGSVTTIGTSAFSGCSDDFYICSDSTDCYAQTYAEENEIAFQVCDGHGQSGEMTVHNYGVFKYIADVETSRAAIIGLNDSFSGGAVDIPSAISGYSVVEIGASAFEKRNDITFVTLPEGLKSIDENAFAECLNLETVVMPDSLEQIGEKAFYKDTKLEFIYLPSSLKTIDKLAFAGCSGITEVTLPGSLQTIKQGAFLKSGITDVYFTEDATEAGLIYYGGFLGCENLQRFHVDVDNFAYRSIDGVLYSRGTSMLLYPEDRLAEEYIVSDKTTNIYGGAFLNATHLETVHIPSSVIIVGATSLDVFGTLNILTDLDDYEITPAQVTICSDSDDCEAKTYAQDHNLPFYVCKGHELETEDCIFNYEIDEATNTVIITGLNGQFEGGYVEIPETIHGLPVTRIKPMAFLTEKAIADAIGATVEDTAEVSGFYVESSNPYFSTDNRGVLFDKQMTKLIAYPTDSHEYWYYSVPDSVQSVEESAFACVSGLQEVIFGAGTVEIGAMAFMICPDLQEVRFFQTTVIGIGDRAFDSCTKLAQMVILDGIESIGEYVFAGCAALEYVHIPNTVTEIGESVFGEGSDAYLCSDTEDCYAKSYADANGIEFRVCEGHTSTLSGNCGKNGDNVQWSLNPETGVLTIRGTGEMADYSWQDDRPWEPYCARIETVVIQDGVTIVGDLAFENCSSLTSVAIPDSVTSIGECAFYCCAGLESVEIPNSSVTIIGDDAFQSCESLTSVTIPDGVTVIGSDAFGFCTGLTSVTIPASVTEIGCSAFVGCTTLVSFTVDENNPSFSSDASGVLYNKEKTELIQYPIGNTRTSFTIPNGVTHLGDEAFDSCKNLTSVTIPNSVTTIGGAPYASVPDPDVSHIPMTGWFTGAFCGCSNLASITLPPSVTSIGNYTFYGCESLTNLMIPNGVTCIGDDTFRDCSGLTSVTIPDSVTAIGENAFNSCLSLESVIIPEGVESIGDHALYRCTSLQFVHLPTSVSVIGEDAFYYFREEEIEGCLAGDYYPLPIYICSDTEDCYAKTYADDNGIEFRVCEGHTKHTHVYDIVITEPTCLTDGFTTYTCTVCGESYVTDWIEAFGHDFDESIAENVTIIEPTETEDGSKTVRCTRCDQVRVTVLPATNRPMLSLSSETARAGQTVEVTVSVEHNPGVVAMQLQLQYDTSLLTLTSIGQNGFFEDGTCTFSKNIETVPFTILWEDPIVADNHTEDGTILTLTFTVSEGAQPCAAAICLAYDTESTFDVNLDNVVFAVQNGEVTITDRVSGDVNHDGATDLKDVVLIRRFLVGGWDVQIDARNADVNADGAVNLKDTVIISRYLAGGWNVELL